MNGKVIVPNGRTIDNKEKNKNTTVAKRTKPVLINKEPFYVVENILKYEWKQYRHQFYVKWKGWDEKENTWEPLTNLSNCNEILVNFLWSYLNYELLMNLCQDTEVYKMPEYDEIERKAFNSKYQETYILELQKRVLTLIAVNNLKRIPSLLHRKSLIQYITLVKRKKQLSILSDWEKLINDSTSGEATIKVENNVDWEGPPTDFIFVTKYIPTKNIIIPEDPPIGCNCETCGPKSKDCCGRETQFAYSKRGRITVKLGTPIYECNKLCKCNSNCRNRVVQNKRKVPLCIFRTDNGRGWGVKTLQNLYPGQYVCQYVGEVIPYEEAERRGKGYDAIGSTYLFDLDFNSNDEPYAVDATNYGNVSHFINHSCDPNVGVWSVWIDCLDPNLPTLALFTLKYVQKNTELTFDYMASKINGSIMPDKANLNKTPCRCNSPMCRKYLF